MSKFLYLEFMQPIKDYFITLKKNEFVFEWIIPLILALTFYFFFTSNLDKYLESTPIMINVLAILVGFSIATITILSTTESKNIKGLKKVLSERKLGGKHLNLYQLLLITFSYILIIEISLLVFNLLLNFFSITNNYLIFFCINIFFIIHILFLNLRNITNIYFVFFRQTVKR